MLDIEFTENHKLNFWKKVKKDENDKCWIWNGMTDKRANNPHGTFGLSFNGINYTYRSQRLAFYFHFGNIDMSKHITMSCKNSLCCNPYHMTQWKDRINNINDVIRICSKCGKTKSIEEFRVSRKDGAGRNSACKSCANKWYRSKESKLRRHKNKAAKKKQERKLDSYRDKYILKDTRKTDRAKNRENNLTRPFILELIQRGCFYCGEINIRIMTLDRIDNSRGHTMDNVNPCCARCNIVRNNMPYEAWLFIIPTIRLAREKGLFGNWVGGKYGFLEPCEEDE